MFKLVATAAISLCFAFSAQAESKVVHVGAILPFSGDAAGIGDAVRNGFEMGLEKLAPEVRERIKVTYDDDGLITQNAVKSFYKLHSSGKVDVLLNVSSGTGLALAPLVERAEVPFISVSSDPAVSRGRKFVFSFWVSPEAEAKGAIDEALRRGYKRVARISTLHNGTIAISDAFDTENAGRLQIVLDERYPTENKDFKTYLAKLREIKDVDAVMIILLPGQCGTFARQLVEAGLKTDMFGFEVFEDATQVELSAGALIGKWYVNADDPDNLFIDAYRAKYPKSSVYGASNGYDAALLLGDAVAKGFTGKEIAKYLSTLKEFRGALGVYSASGDQRFTLPAAIKVVTKTGFEKIR